MSHPNDNLPGWDQPLSSGTRPSWLDPAGEIAGERHHWTREDFVPLLVDSLRTAGCDVLRAFAAAGPLIYETGWGQSGAPSFNLGGVKATKGWAERVAAQTGKPARYYRWRGNRGTGDLPVVWYRAYESVADFVGQWLAQFVPKPGTAQQRYTQAGAFFWLRPASDTAWFREQMRAGYRGPNNVVEPQQSKAVHDQETLARAARVRWCQRALGVVADGHWGPKSMGACVEYQGAHGLPTTGEPDDATAKHLAGER